MNYLKETNILSEGLISNIVSYLVKGKKQFVKDQIKKMKLNRIEQSGILKDIERLNNTTEKLEKSLQKLTGKKINTPTYNLSDFVKVKRDG